MTNNKENKIMANNFYITEDLIAEIEYADLSLDLLKDALCKSFPDAKRIEVVFVEYDEILAEVDGVKYVADSDGNVYKFEDDHYIYDDGEED